MPAMRGTRWLIQRRTRVRFSTTAVLDRGQVVNRKSPLPVGGLAGTENGPREENAMNKKQPEGERHLAAVEAVWKRHLAAVKAERERFEAEAEAERERYEAERERRRS